MSLFPNTWPRMSVRYWNQDPKVNDCFGNSLLWEGPARTEREAVTKACRYNSKNGGRWFRFTEIATLP